MSQTILTNPVVSSSPVRTGTGNGTCTIDRLTHFTVTQDYTLTCIAKSPDTLFAVSASLDGAVGIAIAGVQFYDEDLKIFLTIAQGATAFEVGDQFTFSVSNGSDLNQENIDEYDEWPQKNFGAGTFGVSEGNHNLRYSNTSQAAYAYVQGLKFTAVTAGNAGNSVTFRLITGGTAGSEIVAVSTNAITVQIEDGVSSLTQIKTAFDAFSAATALASCTLAGDSADKAYVMASAVTLQGGKNKNYAFNHDELTDSGSFTEGNANVRVRDLSTIGNAIIGGQAHVTGMLALNDGQTQNLSGPRVSNVQRFLNQLIKKTKIRINTVGNSYVQWASGSFGCASLIQINFQDSAIINTIDATAGIALADGESLYVILNPETSGALATHVSTTVPTGLNAFRFATRYGSDLVMFNGAVMIPNETARIGMDGSSTASLADSQVRRDGLGDFAAHDVTVHKLLVAPGTGGTTGIDSTAAGDFELLLNVGANIIYVGGSTSKTFVQGKLGVGVSPTVDLDVQRATSGGTVGFTLANLSNTVSAKARALIQVAGSTADDPFQTFEIASGQAYSIGIDNSDSDKFKISRSSALGTNDVFNMTSAGASEFAGALNVVGDFSVNTDKMTVAGASGNTVIAGKVSIGGTVDNGTGLRVQSTNLTGVTQLGFASAPIFSSGATTAGYGMDIAVETAAASFTMTNLYNLHIANPTIGVGSTVTTSYGINIADQTTAGTNYAIYTNAGRNRFGDQTLVGTDSFDASYLFDVSKSNVGSTTTARVRNSDNSNTASHGRFLAEVGGASGGDPYIGFLVNGATNWAAGIDNSDSDKFKISSASTLGSSDRMIVTTGGNFGFNIDPSTDPMKMLYDSASSVCARFQNTTAGGAFEVRSEVDTCSGSVGAYSSTYAGITEFQDRYAVLADTTAAGLSLAASAGAGTMKFYTGGVTSSELRATIASDGRLGYGAAPESAILALFRTDQNSSTIIRARNENASTAASVRYDVANGTTSFGFIKHGTGFTSSANLRQNGGALVDTGAGIDIAATNGSGDIRLWTGGTNERLRIDSAGFGGYGGRMAIGSLIADDTTSASALQVLGTSAALATAKLVRFSNDAAAAILRFDKSRGTAIGTATAVAAEDLLGTISFNGVGTDAAAYTIGARISGVAEGTIGSAVVPGRLQFYTSDSAGTSTERLRIDSTGRVLVGTTSAISSTANFQVAGGSGQNIIFAQYSADNAGANLDFRKSRSATIATNSATSSGDQLGFVRFRGCDSANATIEAVRILATQDGAAGSSIVPGKIAIQTADTAGSLTERLNIDSAGLATFANNARVSGFLGVGNAANTTIGIWARPSTSLTGTVQNGIASTPTFTSAATSAGYGVQSNPGTAATSFTMGILANFLATDGTLGSGSAVTRHIGYYVDTITGGTNNAHISDNATFTGDWFINSTSTRTSRISGNFGIGADPNSAFRLDVTGSGSSGARTARLMASDTTTTFNNVAGMLVLKNTSATNNNFAAIKFTDANNNGDCGIYGRFEDHAGAASISFQTSGASGSGAGEKFRIASNGDVCVGSVAPNIAGWGRAFTVIGAGSTAVEVGTSAVTNNLALGIDFVTSGNTSNKELVQIAASIVNGGGSTTNVGASLLFYTKPDGGSVAQRMSLDSTGFLTVGASDLTSLVIGKNSAATASSTKRVFDAQYTVDTDCTGGYFYTCLNSSGTVIGRAEAASNTTVNFTGTSDARLKTGATDFDGLEMIARMQPKEFSWISNPGSRSKGFYAQELHTVLPEAVSVGDDSLTPDGNLARPWGIDYGKVTPVIVKAIQELKAQFDALAAQFAEYVTAHP